MMTGAADTEEVHNLGVEDRESSHEEEDKVPADVDCTQVEVSLRLCQFGI